MDIKTQTPRATRFQEKITNINIFVNNDFEVGVVTSNYWGDFEKREIPLIELEIKGINYCVPLNEFIKIIKPQLRRYKK